MRAIVIPEYGGPEVLVAQEVPTPLPLGQEVRVKVHAFGLNRADLSQRRGHYPAPPGDPESIPGLEFAGEVEMLGEKCLGQFPIGSRVCGIVGGGAYAEYLTLHERLLLPIPDGMSYAEAAAIPEAFLTAYDALFLQGELKIGEKVLIHAVGSGVGSAAVQICRLAGCFVFGASRTRDKLEAVRTYGIDVGIHSAVENIGKVIERETNGLGVDVIIDFIGGSALPENVEALAEKGRLIFVGLLGGSESSLQISTVMRKRLTLRGTVLRSRSLEEKITLIQSFSKEILPQFSRKTLRPVLSKKLTFPDVAEGHRLMEENQTVGKLVVVF